MAAVLKVESAEIAAVANRLVGDASCASAVEKLVQCQGRILLTGMGKMGFVARKAAATFCSTGAPAIYLHPTEAIHGDLGICLLYTSPSPRDLSTSRMPSSA